MAKDDKTTADKGKAVDTPEKDAASSKNGQKKDKKR